MPSTHRGVPVGCVLVAALAACSGDDGAAEGGDTGGAESTPATSAFTTTSTPAETGADSRQLPYEEDFAGPDGDPWPVPWRPIGTHVLAAELAGGRARLAGETTQVARMALPGFDEPDADVTVTVEFDDWSQQGFGFYVRQNGGALLETDPRGQGYAVYTEGGYQRTLGLWREVDGVETMITSILDPVEGGVAPATPYRVRFQCSQESDATRLRAKMWPADQAEPDGWAIDITDATAVLQGASGSFAADVYNYAGTGSIRIDELAITGGS